jgi:nitrous oxidase accessory protein
MRILLAVYLFVFCVNDSIGAIIEVCSSCKYKSISQAVKNAKAGDIIKIRKGIYKESGIEIDKPLSVISEENAVVDGDMKGHIFIISADNVTIKGLTLKNVPVSYTREFSAVYANGIQHFRFLSNTMDNVFFGYLVEKSHKGIIEGNRIKSIARDEAGSGNGIHLWHSSEIQIEDNHVSGMRDGIYLEFVSNSSIIRNVCHDNLRYGLHFMFSNDNEYHYNTFTNNGAGVAVMYSKSILMTNNRFNRNWGPSSYGLLLKEITDSVLKNNLIDENTTGILIDGSSRIQYNNNDFRRNGVAIQFTGASYDNTFESNNFLHNSFDISYQGRMNNNKFDGNYWSSYSGYDLNRDGIGDIPYRPVKLFSYITNKTPESIVLLRSLFIDILNFSEKVSPVFTPDELMDSFPRMKPLKNDKGK